MNFGNNELGISGGETFKIEFFIGFKQSWILLHAFFEVRSNTKLQLPR